MKKVISLFISVVMIIMSVHVSAIPAYAEADGVFNYTVSNGEATVTGVSDSFRGEMTIPETLGGYPVTVIGNRAFAENTKITGAVIPSTVKTIGQLAFDYCTNLESVSIPYSVTVIDRWAFGGCKKLKSVTVPDGVKIIHERTFYGCSALESIDIGRGITTIGESAFEGCTSLKVITMGDAISSVSYDAFRECYVGTLIMETSDLKTLCESGGYTLANQFEITPTRYISLNGELLTELAIPEGTKSIPSGLFNNCKTITDITIPDSVTSVGGSAFNGTAYYNNEDNWTDGLLYIDNHLVASKPTAKGDIAVKDGTLTIAEYAFRNSQITGITVPDSVVYIGGSAFANAANLTEISLPDKPIMIELAAFWQCGYYQKTENWDKNALYIGNHLIDTRNVNGHFTVKDSTVSIAGYAFSDSKSLPSVYIPVTVEKIGEEAFYYCNVKAVHYGGTEEQWNSVDMEPSTYGIYDITTMHYNITSAEDHYECTVTAEATCTVSGKCVYSCPCGYSYESVLPAGHDFIKHDGKEPTCTEDGYAPYTTCGRCDYTTYTALPMGHNTIFVYSKSPTCTEPGHNTYSYCTRCDYTSYKEIPATGHTETEIRDAVEPTTQTEGYTGNVHCSICGIKLSDGEVIPKLEPPYTVGDVNDSDSVNLTDVALLMQYLADWDVVINADAADANGSGRITLSDASLLMQYLAGWDVTLG